MIATTREDIENAHWKELGHCLGELYKTHDASKELTHKASKELTELAKFLTNGEVT